MKHLSLIILSSLVLFSLGIFPISCQKRPIKIDKKTEKLIEKLATEQILLLRVEYDSLCAVSFDQHVQKYMDSIRLERLEEIRNLHQ